MGRLEPARLDRELEDYRTIGNPDLVYFPRNVSDSILARHRQIKNFSSRYDSMPWVDKLPAEDRRDFETGYKNVREFNRRWVAAGGKIQAVPTSSPEEFPDLPCITRWKCWSSRASRQCRH